MKTQRKTVSEVPEGAVKNTFFIAANGYSGFRSRYDSVFRSLAYSHVYIIKGGPGTGKSRMMSEIAKEVEKQGGNVEYIYCSSDPTSLDGVILMNKERRIAILDGTAPHTRCTDYPGVIDEIVNLGEFWDGERLSEQKKEVVRLCQEKSLDYRMAYRYLSLAGVVDDLITELLVQCLDQKKMMKAAARTVRACTPSAQPKETVQYWTACSMKGKISLSPVPKSARVVCVCDYLGSARFYLNALRDALREAKQYAYVLIPSCYTDERTEGIYLPDDNLLFISGDERAKDKSVNMRRFLLHDRLLALRPKLRRLSTLHESMTDTAVAYLREAGTHHFALEEIYGSAMDFGAKEKYVKQLSARIQKQLFSAVE